MEFTDLQMTLTVVVILTAAAVAVFFDYRRKQRLQPQRIYIQNTERYQRSTGVYDFPPLDYAPAKKLALERPLEPLVGIATPSRPPVEPRMARETVTVEIAPPTAAEFQLDEVTLPAFTIDAALWESLIGSQPKQNLLSPSNSIEATSRMIQNDMQEIRSPSQPVGMIQPPVLEEMLQSDAPFTGLVISIGINDADSSMWHSQGLMQSVANYISGLLREQDFACRTAYDEFVMVCRGEQGANSQRRLNYVSERLWDYQLRGIGACSILFSWGGVQVQDQPLADAIASATERMRETKRSGNLAKSALALRQAV
jgi:hypothetical protein